VCLGAKCFEVEKGMKITVCGSVADMEFEKNLAIQP
jgi:hypothetical protein